MRYNISAKILGGLFFLAVLLQACSKEDNKNLSGTVTIDNTLYGQTVYYAIGFSFDKGKTLPTHEEPPPDITVHALTDNDGNVTEAYLDTFVLLSPFSLAGEFENAQGATDFYNNLLEVGSPAWIATATPVKENQVWIFKTANRNYAKFRVISILLEKRGDTPFAQIKFEWQVQPDGSTSFE